MKNNKYYDLEIALAAALGIITTGQAVSDDTVVSVHVNKGSSGALDYRNAKAMPLPRVTTPPTSQLESLQDAQSNPPEYPGPAGVSIGQPGTGKQNPVILVPSDANQQAADSIESQSEDDNSGEPQSEMQRGEYGTAKQVYTTNRTNNSYGSGTYSTTRYAPFRAAGRLWFKIGSVDYVCSAALIKKGVIVTAAHCVAEFGKNQWHTDFKFAAAYDNGVAPFNTANGKSVTALTSYLNGTDSCASAGVVCKDDVAVIVLDSNVGSSTGYFGYGWNGYSYANNQALITQLGYPVALDSGNWQERTDSQGYVSSAFSNNTIIGSLQTGGSSGGPWIVNLGIAPSLSGISFGTASNRNIIVGVTSWGSSITTIKLQGASPFTSTNIVPLVNAACAAYPSSC